MTQSRRYVLLLAAGLLLLLVLIFQQSLVAYVVLPFATAVWVLLRIFVLSIDQHVYWWVLITAIALAPLIREMRKIEPARHDLPTASNPWLERVASWRASILADVHEVGERSIVKHDLIWLLASLYATGQRRSAEFQVKNELEAGNSDLPAEIYDFLWSTRVPARTAFLKDPGGFARHIFQSVRAALRLRMRRWTGRETAEYYLAIEQVLDHMETSLEMDNDDEPREH